jgi:hypothetical protein
MKGLILHRGTEAIERAALAAIALPEHTDSYAPIGHDHFVNVVQDQLDAIGFRFSAEAYGVTRGGARFFGVAELAYAGSESNGRNSLTVGFRSSLDKSIAPMLAFGSRVLVCDNMAFSGEIVISRKQTTYIARDFPARVRDVVATLSNARRRQDARFDCYQSTKLSDGDAEHGMIELLRRGAVNTSRMERLVSEWDNPSYDHGDKSVWRLFNAATETLKESPIADITRRTIGVQSLCDEIAGFAFAEAA